MDHIDAMDALRRGIGLRGYGQRDPVVAYRQEGWEMFDDMVSRNHTETASILLKAGVRETRARAAAGTAGRRAQKAAGAAPSRRVQGREGGAQRSVSLRKRQEIQELLRKKRMSPVEEYA